MAIEVTLTEDELIDSLRFVHRVREKKRHHDVVDKKFDRNNSSYSVNLMGRLGEVVVAKTLQIPTDDSVTAGGDVGFDLVSHLGNTIAVKTSTLDSLIFNKIEDFSASIALLVKFVGDKQLPHDGGKFFIIGWISRQDFIDNHYLHDYGYGMRLVIDGDKLNPIEEYLHEVPAF
jgi:hypothetical protein